MLVKVAGTPNATHNYNVNTGSAYPVVQYPVTPLDGFAQRAVLREFTHQPRELHRWHVEHGRRDRDGAVDARLNLRQQSAERFPGHRRQRTTGPPLNSDADYQSLCLSLPPTTTQFQDSRGVRWHYGAPGHSMYNHRRAPNDKLPDCRGGLPHSNRSDPLWSWLSLNITARSLHPGGVNSLLADGHVQFIKDSINVATWQALGSRNGGEVISSDALLTGSRAVSGHAKPRVGSGV